MKQQFCEYNSPELEMEASKEEAFKTQRRKRGWKMEKVVEFAATSRGSKGVLGPLAIAAPGEWLFADSVRILTAFLFVFVGTVVISLVVLFNRGCPLEDFQCWDSTCIPKEKFCDGAVLDCSQGEDEEEAYCQMRGQLNSVKNVFRDLEGEHICDLKGIPGFNAEYPRLRNEDGRNASFGGGSVNLTLASKIDRLLKNFFNRLNKKVIIDHAVASSQSRKDSYTNVGGIILHSKDKGDNEYSDDFLPIKRGKRHKRDGFSTEDENLSNGIENSVDNSDYRSAITIRRRRKFIVNDKAFSKHIFSEPEVLPNSTVGKGANFSETFNIGTKKDKKLLFSELETILNSLLQNYDKKYDENSGSPNFHGKNRITFNNVTKLTTKKYILGNSGSNLANISLDRLINHMDKAIPLNGVESEMSEFYDSLLSFLKKAHSMKIYPDVSYNVVTNSSYTKSMNVENLDKIINRFLSEQKIPVSNFSLNSTIDELSKSYSTNDSSQVKNSADTETYLISLLDLSNLSNVVENYDDLTVKPSMNIDSVFNEIETGSFENIEHRKATSAAILRNLTERGTRKNENKIVPSSFYIPIQRAEWNRGPTLNVFSKARNPFRDKGTKESPSIVADNVKKKSSPSNGPTGLSTTTGYGRFFDSGEGESSNNSERDQDLQVQFLLPDCTCEFRTIVKCSNVSSVPANIVGGMTKLVLSNNRITEIDPKVMGSYDKLQQGLYLQNNFISALQPRVFSSQNMLKRLFLHENHLTNLYSDSCIGLSQLEIFHLYENNLTYIDLHCFEHTPMLHTLLLSRNKLTLVDEEFPALQNLKFLDLQRNKIPYIQQQLFEKLTSLKTLSLQHNKISSIHANSFENLRHLEDLDLSNNRILRNVAHVFKYLSALQSLNLRGVQLDSTSYTDYQNLTSLKRVYFPRLRYCAFVEQVDHCEPRSDGITSKEDLMQSAYLRVCVWVVAFVTLSGNVAVLLCRGISRNDDEILVFFIKNLAMADLLMGIYLVIVGTQDQMTRGSFYRHANGWTSSNWCTVAGCLALVSSESSVFILAYMSLQRYLYISRTLHGDEYTIRFARRSLIVIWVTSIMIALFPVLGMTSFYGMNAMCFPLHISEPYFEGWQFSAFVFLGLNSLSMVVIVGSYVLLFINIKLTRSKTPLSKTDLSFVLRFLFIVLTDIICWLPILAFKLVALAEVPITGEVYAWLVVLVVPINSAINPILYTFSTSHFLNNVQKTLTKVRPSWLTKESDSGDTFRLSSNRSRQSYPTGQTFQHLQSTVPTDSFLSTIQSSETQNSKSPDSIEYEDEGRLSNEQTKNNRNRVNSEDLTIEFAEPEKSFAGSSFCGSYTPPPPPPAIRLTCKLKNVGSLSLTVVREIKREQQICSLPPQNGTIDAPAVAPFHTCENSNVPAHNSITPRELSKNYHRNIPFSRISSSESLRKRMKVFGCGKHPDSDRIQASAAKFPPGDSNCNLSEVKDLSMTSDPLSKLYNTD